MGARMPASLLLAVLAPAWAPSPTGAANYLEILVQPYESSGSGETAYVIYIEAAADEAGFARLETPRGTFDFNVSGGWLYPNPTYLAYHTGLTFAELQGVLAEDWVLSWNPGVPGWETVATISFGPISESDFPPRPNVTHPEPATYAEPTTSIDWEVPEGSPCAPEVDRIEVRLNPPGYDFAHPVQPCDAQTWSPAAPLEPGSYTAWVELRNDFREVPDGISVSGEPWTPGNEAWFVLLGSDQTFFSVAPVSVETMSFGRVKAMYR